MSEYRPYKGKKGKEILYDWTPQGEKPIYRTPRQLIDSINAAKDEMSYSNYDNANFDRVKEIIRIWAKYENVFLGFKSETLIKRSNKKFEDELNKLMEKLNRVE